MSEDIDIDELQESRDELVQTAIQQAQQYHAIMDAAKEWARETATDLRVEAALEDDEETADEIAQVAGIVETVTARVEQGDNSRARSVGQ